MVAWICVIILILQAVAVTSQSPAILSVTNVIPGATATFECSLANLASPTPLDIYKDNVALYQCTNIAFQCSKSSSDSDYSDVTFTALSTASAKGTFTVANADQTRDGGDWTCQYGTSSLSSPDTFVVSAQSAATLSVTNVIQGATATFECSYPNLESPTSLDIHKDSVALYQCTDIALICSESSTDSDYSDISFTDLDTASAKGTFTVANADQTRDGGDWTCQYGTSLISSSVTFVVIAQSPATLSVTNVLHGATATFECSYPSLTSPTALDIYKDNVALYTCTDIALTCSKSSTDKDYSGVTFTGLGTASAKGTFTVTNTDRKRDGGEWACKYGSSIISPTVTFVVTAPAILSVTNVLHGATATFECSYHRLTSPTALYIYKDNVTLYQCTNIAETCRKSSTDTDYSDVTFTDLGKASAKGTFTVANADHTSDGGVWTCKYGTSLISVSVSFVVTDVSLWCSFPEDGDNWPCIVLIICLICGGIGTVVGICLCCLCCSCCCCYFLNKQTVHHIGYMTIEKVTHDSIQLRWSMDGLPPKTPGLKSKYGEQQPKTGHKMDGTHTVTVENMAPDTIITIYLEYTKMDGTHCKEMLLQIQTMKDHIRDMTIQKVNRDTIHLRWSMNGGNPITPGLKAICGIQHPRVCHETDGTHTVTVENLAPDTSNTIYLEYSNKGGTHYKEKLIRTQTLKVTNTDTKKTTPV